MKDLNSLDIASYISLTDSDKNDVIDAYIAAAKADPYNAVVRMETDYIQSHRDTSMNRSLAWLPIGIKDNFLIQGTISSCGSQMLETYIAPYTSTCIQNLVDAGALMIAKCNMDEFAMGTSGESSFWGPTSNPRDTNKVPGGSSSGSAAAVAWWLCIASLGTDTWWSVRMPAALCGLVWIKPTYGRVSRYGIQSMSSSLDQAGVLTKTVEDAALLLNHMSGHDLLDATSVDTSAFEETKKPDSRLDLWDYSLTGKRFALPKQYITDALDERIYTRLREVVSFLESQWAVVDEIDIPLLEYGVSTYYIICPAEVSTNLARFDGIRFGLQWDMSEYDDLNKYYADIRTKGFGDEVRRRILTGTYVLSAWHYDAYYQKAQRVRQQLRNTFADIYKQYDAIIWPTSPSPAWDLGSLGDDPTQLYLMDIYTVIANLSWNPAISVPMGTVRDGAVDLPVWFQIMTDMWDERTAFGVASYIQKNSF